MAEALAEELALVEVTEALAEELALVEVIEVLAEALALVEAEAVGSHSAIRLYKVCHWHHRKVLAMDTWSNLRLAHTFSDQCNCLVRNNYKR